MLSYLRRLVSFTFLTWLKTKQVLGKKNKWLEFHELFFSGPYYQLELQSVT